MTRRTVHVAVYDGLADWEIGHVTAHINDPEGQRDPGSLRIVTVGATADPITTAGGLRLVPDTVLADLDPTDSALLILPGASTWMTDGNAAFQAAATAFVETGTPVAAICGATFGLATAGLLDDRAHTSNAAEFLASSGYGGAPLYRDELATTDRGVVTASAIAPVEFAREILALLDVYEPRVLASWYKLYGQHDPAGYYELQEATA